MDSVKKQVEEHLAPLLSQMGLTSVAHMDVQPVEARLWLSNAFKVGVTTTDDKKVALFIKSLPGDMLRKEIFGAPAFFRNEVAFYNHVVPVFQNFQKSRVDPDQAFSAVPCCYHANSDGENDVIVLEDMQAKGYVMVNSQELLSLSQLHLVMRELGRFHALSLAMKDQQPEEFAKLRNKLEETVWNDRFINILGKRMFSETCKESIRMLKEIYPEDHQYVKTLQLFLDNIVSIMKYQVTPQEPLSVITHGDFWVNNFLFQYSEPEVLESLCFIDFQQSRYGSPALDLGYALFICMDKATRDVHKDALLRSYYDSLSELLRALGSDPEQIFAFENIEQELQKYSVYALANSFMNLPQALDKEKAGVEEFSMLEKLEHVQLSVEDIVNIVISEIERPHNRKTEDCKERILDGIREVVEKGCMDSLKGEDGSVLCASV